MGTFDENRFYELLSALQKSIRRCEVNASRYFAQQLMGMDRPYVVPSQLILYAAEDIGLADPSLIVYERQCSDNYKNLIKQKGIKPSEIVNYPQLLDIVDRGVIAAAISYKSRDLPMLSFVTLFDIYNNENFSKSTIEYINLFVKALDNKDEKQALYYAYVIGIFINSKNEILKIIQRESGRRNQDLIKAWVDEYKGSKYKTLIVLAGSVLLLCRDLDFTHGEYKNAINQYVSLPIKAVKIPDYAYDRHTDAGKKRGRGWEQFFKEGAKLKNERFPNRWEMAGREAYFSAEKKKLDDEDAIIRAIKKKCKATNTPGEILTI